MKKIATIVSMLLVAALLLVSCAKPVPGASEPAVPAESESASPEAESYKIGVIQFAAHPSLDNCYNGFVQGLKEEGLVEGENLTIDFQNAQGEVSNADLQAKNMVTSKYNLLCGIATPAAMSCYSAAKEEGVPVIFSAVSDPVAAGVVQSLEKPGSVASGTADSLNLEGQMKMIRAFLPEAKKIGIIYTTSEPNSVTHLEKFKELAPNYGFEIEAVGVTNASEVGTAAQTLITNKVDCINNFTDNNVVDNLSVVLHAANEAKIPVFGSEEEQVKNGCLASESLDYVELGKETGRMAAKVLKGEAKPADMAVSVIAASTPVYNKTVLDALGLTLPADYAAAADLSAAQ